MASLGVAAQPGALSSSVNQGATPGAMERCELERGHGAVPAACEAPDVSSGANFTGGT